MTQTVELMIHTNAGQSVSTYIESPDNDEPEEIADQLVTELASRPRWLAFGNVAFFSGAITLIEVDIHDSEGGST